MWKVLYRFCDPHKWVPVSGVSCLFMIIRPDSTLLPCCSPKFWFIAYSEAEDTAHSSLSAHHHHGGTAQICSVKATSNAIGKEIIKNHSKNFSRQSILDFAVGWMLSSLHGLVHYVACLSEAMLGCISFVGWLELGSAGSIRVWPCPILQGSNLTCRWSRGAFYHCIVRVGCTLPLVSLL